MSVHGSVTSLDPTRDPVALTECTGTLPYESLRHSTQTIYLEGAATPCIPVDAAEIPLPVRS